jgi:NADH dehydrogenase
VIARLVAEGERPRALVRNVPKARKVLPAQGVEILEGDTTRAVTLAETVPGADTIIHCAFVVANRKQTAATNYYRTNVAGTRNLVAAAKDAGVRRIVVMGGLGTRPSKQGSYMQGRYEADQIVRQSGLASSILGASVQFGRGSAFINGLADLVKSPLPVVPMIGSGRVKFQPIWVEDVVTCLLKMAREPQRYDGRYIEVGGPEVYTYGQILDLLMQRLGKRKIKVPGPKPLAAVGAGVMEALLPNPPITVAALGLFDFDNVTALDAVPREFGFAPASFKDYLATHPVE